MREWTNDDLKSYVTLFNDQVRDTVLKDILEADILARFLSTAEGRLVLNSIVDDITGDILTILKLSGENFEKHIGEIRQAAMKVVVSYDMMRRLATIAVKGESHVDQMKKRRK
uniref:Uncharacterized protein n=1 Tax=viral metagenome TaxID=1070528 RepID=A0A6M3LGL8_9ZZZZ